MGRRVKVNAGMIRCGQGLCSQQAGQGVESPATSLGSVVVMLVARDLAASARAQREDVVEGAILRRARPSQRARRHCKGERCGGVAGQREGRAQGQAPERFAKLTSGDLNENLNEALERELERKGAQNSSKCHEGELVMS